MDKLQYVVFTRSPEDISNITQEIKKLGKEIFIYPTINFRKKNLSDVQKAELRDLAKVDWLLFTSQNGVGFLAEILNDLDVDLSVLKLKKIGAVGEKTAQAVRKLGMRVGFVPQDFTSEDLANGLPEVKNKKILLARSTIANPTLKKILELRGAEVIDLPVYKTELVKRKNSEFINFLKNNQVVCLVFTSPSTVKGLLKNLDLNLRFQVFSLPALAIGPTTTNFLSQSGFKKVYTAKVFNSEGVLEKLREII